MQADTRTSILLLRIAVALAIVALEGMPLAQAGNQLIAEAAARVGVRLAPGQAPEAMVERVVRFLEAGPDALQFAVEVRDRELLTPGYFPILRDHGATHVFNFWSRMPDIGAQLALPGCMPGPFVVARLMLPPGMAFEDARQRFAPFDRIVQPQPKMRADVVRLIREAVERGFEVYVIVNNKAEGSSPLTVRALAELLRDAQA